MPSKTIMIDIEVYKTLKLLKKNKSFSEIIRELIEKNSILPISSLGLLKNEDDKLDFKSIKNARREKDVSI